LSLLQRTWSHFHHCAYPGLRMSSHTAPAPQHSTLDLPPSWSSRACTSTRATLHSVRQPDSRDRTASRNVHGMTCSCVVYIMLGHATPQLPEFRFQRAGRSNHLQLLHATHRDTREALRGRCTPVGNTACRTRTGRFRTRPIAAAAAHVEVRAVSAHTGPPERDIPRATQRQRGGQEQFAPTQSLVWPWPLSTNLQHINRSSYRRCR
jgi:hypothetical protein